MNPEDQLKHLRDDDSAWDLAPIRAVRPRRRWAPVIVGVAVAAVAVVVVVGALQLRAFRTEHPAVPTSTPTAVATTAPGAEPSIAFDGDCSAVLAPDALASALGTAMPAYVDPVSLVGTPTDGNGFQLAQRGGTYCEWGTDPFSMKGADRYLEMAVVPEAALPGATGDTCGTVDDDALIDFSSCAFDVTVGDYRVIGALAAKNADVSSQVDAVISALTASIADVPAVVPTPDPSAWANPADCAALAPWVQPVVTTGVFRGKGTWVQGPFAGTAVGLFDPLGGANTADCGWSRETPGHSYETFTLSIHGGGAWTLQKVLDDPSSGSSMRELAVPGWDRVIEIDQEVGGPSWVLQDGVNAIAVYAPQRSLHEMLPVLDAAREALDAQH